MEYDRIGIFLIWNRPEMDLPEMDRFHMPEMEYSLGNKKIKIKIKQNGVVVEKYTRLIENRKRGGKDICTRGGSNPGLPSVGLHSQPLG